MGKSNHILYLTYDGLSDPLGQSQIIPYLAGLASKGFDIAIVSCEKEDRYNKDSDSIRSTLADLNINWYPVPYSNKIPVISSFQTVRALYKEARRVQQLHHSDIIHCRSTLPAIAGLRVKRSSGAKLIFDMRGFWADERVEGKIWDINKVLFRFIYNYIKKQEDTLLHESDHIVSLTEAGKKIIENQQHIITPVTVIPCCADYHHFDPHKISADQKIQLRNNLNIAPEAPVIIYTGSIGTWYLLDEMMHFFKRYLLLSPDAVFLLVTREPYRLIHDAAQKYGIYETQFRIASASRAEMPLYLSIASVALYFIKPGFSKQASSPVKQGEALAMDLPVITNKGIGDSDIIIGDSFGWLVKDFTDASFDEVIREQINTKTFTGIRERSQQLLSLENGIERYGKIYMALTDQ